MNNSEDQGTSSSSSSSSCSSYYCSSKMMGVSEDQQPHVLAVDDNVIDRKLIEKLLKTSSCKDVKAWMIEAQEEPVSILTSQVTTAENAMTALEYLGIGEDQQNNSKACNVNLILTDYCMPGMTGYDLLKKIKESSQLREVPVVIMSSENVPTRINKCLEEGAQMFMLKPLKLSDVKKLRCQAMKRKH